MTRQQQETPRIEDLVYGFDRVRHQKVTEAAIQALEVSGLQLEPKLLSDMILRLYELASQNDRPHSQ